MWNSYLQENAKEFSSRLEFLKNRKFQNDQLFLRRYDRILKSDGTTAKLDLQYLRDTGSI